MNYTNHLNYKKIICSFETHNKMMGHIMRCFSAITAWRCLIISLSRLCQWIKQHDISMHAPFPISSTNLLLTTKTYSDIKLVGPTCNWISCNLLSLLQAYSMYSKTSSLNICILLSEKLDCETQHWTELLRNGTFAMLAGISWEWMEKKGFSFGSTISWLFFLYQQVTLSKKTILGIY